MDEINEEILNKIRDVIGNSSAFGGSFVRVAITDNNINLLKKVLNDDKNVRDAVIELRNEMRAGNATGNATREEQAEGRNETNSLLGGLLNVFGFRLNRSLDRYISDEEKRDKTRNGFWIRFKDENGKKLDFFSNTLKNFENIWKVGPLKFLSNGLARHIPIIGGALPIVAGLIQKWIELQWGNIQAYKELINAGVFYKDSFSSLHRYASMIGMKSEDLVKALTQNSLGIARLYGVTDNGVSAFARLLKGVRETGIEIGMNFKTSVQIAGQMAEDSALHMFMTGQSMENLVTQTEIYQKQLQKLSLATGKSTESILADAKARDDEVAKRLWLSDPKNKMMYNVMRTQGYDDKVIESFIRGVPTEAFIQAGAFSAAVREDLERKWELQNNRFNYSDEEYGREAYETMKQFNMAQAQEELKFYGNNMLLVSALANNNEGFKNSFMVIQTMPGVVDKNYDEIMGKNNVLSKFEDIHMRIIKIWEDFLKKLSSDLDSRRMNNLLTNIDIFFIRLEKALIKLLDGDFKGAYKAMTTVSEDEVKKVTQTYNTNVDDTNEKINKKTEEFNNANSKEEKIKALEELKELEGELEGIEESYKEYIQKAQKGLKKNIYYSKTFGGEGEFNSTPAYGLLMGFQTRWMQDAVDGFSHKSLSDKQIKSLNDEKMMYVFERLKGMRNDVTPFIETPWSEIYPEDSIQHYLYGLYDYEIADMVKTNASLLKKLEEESFRIMKSENIDYGKAISMAIDNYNNDSKNTRKLDIQEIYFFNRMLELMSDFNYYSKQNNNRNEFSSFEMDKQS